jgi:hypothetical protein
MAAEGLAEQQLLQKYLTASCVLDYATVPLKEKMVHEASLNFSDLQQPPGPMHTVNTAQVCKQDKRS